MSAATKLPDHPFRAIRRAAVPLSVFESADPGQSILSCIRAMNGKRDDTILLEWDIARGLRGRNECGQSYVKRLSPEQQMQAQGPGGVCSVLCSELPVNDSGERKIGGVIFTHHMDRYWDAPDVMQALWNCRDTFKEQGITLVSFGASSRLPLELRNDIPIFTETVPDETEIGRIIDTAIKDSEIEPGTVDRARSVDGLLGYLSAFAVEQSFYLALRTKSDRAEHGPVDFDLLWRLKVQTLKNCAGLTVSMPKAGFDRMAGGDGIKRLLALHLAGRQRPRAVLQLDELEKAAAGSTGGDLSGTSQAIMEQFLFWTQEKRVKGFLLVGVPGAGKSLTCEVAAAEAHCPLLRASLSTVKGSLVGQSEQQMRNMLSAVDAVAQGQVLMLATCNSLDQLSPELMARFTLGIVWYDYPAQAEADSLWRLYQKRYEREGDTRPAARNWVGREIESCCERAWLWNIPLAEAAKSVVPVSIANASKMDALRRNADGRFLSANTGEIYRIETAQTAPIGGRRLTA